MMRRMRSLGLMLTAAALTVAATAGPAAAATDCGNISDTVGAIKATNVSCKKAKKLVRAQQQDGKDHFGYTCKFKYYEGGGTFTCKKAPDKKVKFSIAD
jgi:hypothetical protein